MAYQRSDPSREFVDKRSEVLSDSTDLNVLLDAILGDESAPAPVKAWPRQAVDARPEPLAVARPQPTLVALPRLATEPDGNFGPSTVPGDYADAGVDDLKEFLSEVGQKNLQAADPEGTSPEFASLIASPVPSRSWRDLSPVPTLKQSLLVAGLLAAALLTLSVTRLRDDQDDSVLPPSRAADLPMLVPAASTVELPITAPAPDPANAVDRPPARGPTDVADRALEREPTAKPRVIQRPPPTQANDRTNPVLSEVLPPSLPSSSGAPLGLSPTVPQRVAEEADRGTTPTRTALPDVDLPRSPSPAASPEAVAPTVAGGAESVVPTPASPVPAMEARRTPPRLLTGRPPEYPAALRTARVGGTVEVLFTIDSIGRVKNARSVSGPPQLRAVAEAAVRGWRYEPAHLGNLAVDTQTSVNFNFDPSANRRPQD